MAPGHSSDDEFTVAIKIGGEPYASGVYYGQTQGGGIDNENPKQADDQGYVKMRAVKPSILCHFHGALLLK